VTSSVASPSGRARPAVPRPRCRDGGRPRGSAPRWPPRRAPAPRRDRRSLLLRDCPPCSPLEPCRFFEVPPPEVPPPLSCVEINWSLARPRLPRRGFRGPRPPPERLLSRCCVMVSRSTFSRHSAGRARNACVARWPARQSSDEPSVAMISAANNTRIASLPRNRRPAAVGESVHCAPWRVAVQ